MNTMLIDPPEDYSLAGHEQALAEALSLADDDPDKAELVEAAAQYLRIFQGHGALTEAQIAAAAPLRAALGALRLARDRSQDDPGRAAAIAAAQAEVDRHRDIPLDLPPLTRSGGRANG